MNCQNCSAPLVIVDGRGYFRCDHCTTFHFPEEASRDRAAVAGGPVGKDCPNCRVELVEGLLDKRPVAFCENCRGVLVRNQDFSEIIRQRRRNANRKQVMPHPLNADELKRQIACPICSKRMDVHPYHGPGNVVIDTCFRCRIVWFDHGEISAIETAPGAV